jgi:signal transduction histidine kinase
MIVRRAVEAHGGTVRAESSPGNGLKIVVALPE